MPDALAPQIPYVYQVVEAFNVPILLEEGYEADDIIGTVATRSAEDGFRVTIISGDKDLFQLVSPAIQVFDPIRGKMYGVQEVEDRYGVAPQVMVDLMSLTGDTVDNIPGVPGVGEKTASALLQEFGTVEDLFGSLDRIKRPKLREALKTHAEQVRMNRALIALRTNLPVSASPQALRCPFPDWRRLRALFRELEFTRLLTSLEAAG
jgi:DNA polymerase-1